MRRSFILIVVVVVLLALQDALVRHPLGRTDVAALVVVYLALERPVISGAVLAVLTGYLSDLFVGTHQGHYALTMGLLFFLLRLVVVRFSGNRFVFVTAVAILAGFSSLVIALLVEAIVGPNQATVASAAPALGPLILTSTLLGYPAYRILKAVDDRYDEPEDEMVFGG